VSATASVTTAPTQPPAPEPLEHRQVLVVFGGLILVMLLAALDSTIVATALPTIVGELGGLERLAWVVTAYLLAQTVVTPLYGKLGDLYGRKPVLQSAIVVFLVGSALCGLARNMTQLVLFRALQGLGGGGLAVTTQAVVGDIVTPRERGRYQGIFGAVFGLSSIAGPLLGGYFTTHWTWRWIFYINLPLGILALFVIGAILPRQSRRVQHAVDYAGAALLAVALSAMVLLTDLGGQALAWSSAPVLALIGAAVLALALFIVVERRAREPVLPLHLFGNRTFATTSAVGLVVGFALFGSVTYLPLYLQVVKGMSPTTSGLQMLPMMGGMLLTSIASGQLISRTGRYRFFPIVGTLVMALGLWLMSRLGPTTSIAAALGIMAVLGLGLGMVMQVLVIAVQNAVDYADLGVATSGATLFRLVGGSLGTAVLGAIFAARLSVHLTELLPPGAGAPGGRMGGGMNPEVLRTLPPALRAAYAQAFSASLDTVFLVAMAIALVGFAITWLVPERPLRETIAAAAGDVGFEAGEAFPMPGDEDGLRHLLRGALRIAGRDVERQYIEQIVRRAGIDLTPTAAWLLVRIDEEPTIDPATVARAHDAPTSTLHGALAELVARGLVEGDETGTGVVRHTLTPAGCDVLTRLDRARRSRLAELFAKWKPEPGTDSATVLQRLAGELVPEVDRTPVRG
jgi:EmrB/QacA subfamily drug resistance transporter